MWYHLQMGKYEKQLEKMRNNPRDWRIEELKAIADRCQIDYRQPGSSHVTFRFPNKKMLTVPSHKPIKPVYIQQFIALLDELE